MISRKAKIHPSVKIGENAVIMDGAVILSGTKISNNVVIYPGTRIGRGVLILDNCILGRQPFNPPNLDRRPKKNLPGLSIGDGCQIGGNVILYRGTKIGSGVMVCDFSSVREECVIADNVVVGRNVLINYQVKIGKSTRIMDGCHFGGNMVIEENVFLGPYVCSANDNYMGMQKRNLKRTGAHLKKGCRIGLGCILLADISVGKNAIIGAGSLVNKDVEDNWLAYGVPARAIRKL
ncbi:MAG: DapH/DapD/GlmU-related protein [Candidatus Omnitrophica bacterium]|nr:DapH/DapD/GlmU-related protein [Candidatus Omnitrophota bacterium]